MLLERKKVYSFSRIKFYMIQMPLKQLRIEKGLTQILCAKFLGVPIRTCVRYENDHNKANSIKYHFMAEN